MASQDRGRDRVSRKVTTKRMESAREARGLSLDMPERFKDGDDAHEDVTAPKRNNAMSMNQSIFSMIARAGQQSQADLGTMQEVDSGDSDSEQTRKTPYYSLDGAARLSRLSTANDFQALPEDVNEREPGRSKHRRVMSENKLLRSLPKLKTASRKDVVSEGQGVDPMSSSQFLPPRPSVKTSSKTPTREQPVSTKAAVSAKHTDMEKERSSGRRSRQESSPGPPKSKAPVTLATRIQQIFDFEEVEEVISEYPCWLLQSILLQGYMYITQKHICFYAYIPKKHVRNFPKYRSSFEYAADSIQP